MTTDDDTDFVTQVEGMTAYVKKMQLPLSQYEREALTSLYQMLISVLEDNTSELTCPTCGSTDGFHTEDACLEQ